MQSINPIIEAFLKLLLNAPQKSRHINVCFSITKAFITFVIPAVAGPMNTAKISNKATVDIIEALLLSLNTFKAININKKGR